MENNDTLIFLVIFDKMCKQAKRSWTLILATLCLAPAQGQLQSELNLPRAGDVIIKQQVEYKDPGRTGENVLWDFSQLDVVNDEYELVYSTPDDTVIIGAEHTTQYHYVLRNDSLMLLGFDNQTTRLHNIQPEVLLKFPFNHGDTIGSYFYAHGKYSNRLELDVMGTTRTVADSYGMMILPNKDTLKHVLRLRTIKYIAENMNPITESYYEKLHSPLNISFDSIVQRLATDTVLFVVETFRWYEKGYRYPVFETVRSWQKYRSTKDYTFLNTAFFYPPQEHYYLDDDLENLALLENFENEKHNEEIDVWAELTYNIFPNPVKSTPLQVEIYLPVAANIRLQMNNTMGNLVLNIDKGHHSAGTYNFQVNMNNLPVGNYALDIMINDKVIKGIVMKR